VTVVDGRSPELEPAELSRYARHLSLPEVGLEGQKRLKGARVLVVGAGGLGSPLALYLAAAGVGRLGLVDFDQVDVTNLQRQILHGTKDVGRDKLDSAGDRLADVNPNVEVVSHAVRLNSDNALDILEPYDVVVDGTDNFPTRYLVNDASVLLGKPNVYGSIFRWEGQVSVFGFDGGPCYRCLFREPPPPGLVLNCAEAGVLGVLPGIIGSLQALEVIKLILGKGTTLSGRLLIFDAMDLSWREVALRRNPECPVCGDAPTQTNLIDYEDFCGLRSKENDMPPVEGQEPQPTVREIGPLELKERLGAGDAPLLLDVREPYEWDIASLAEFEEVRVPLGQLLQRLSEIPDQRDIVVYCRSGARSRMAAGALVEAGYKCVDNLTGGILAWSDEIDPSLPKY
jgi:molybdopterin/thiamine biosynthesis adenylyltransferase/rhodanese-related sulfurtransferase